MSTFHLKDIDQFSSDLTKAFQGQLPGRDAQYGMAHAVRNYLPKTPSDARKAGVMAMFYQKTGEWHLALIERQSSNPNDRHGGQVSFPGGKYELSDPDLKSTALRETEEEIGVNANDIEVIAELSQLYIPVSNFQVFPFVGVLPYQAKFTPQIEEVRSILEVKLFDLINPSTRKITNLQVNKQITLNQVPYFDLENKVVWGATAMMLNELITVLERIPEVRNTHSFI